MMNKLLRMFKEGRQSLGTVTHMRSVTAIEALGLTGLDYVWIDMEHCPLGIESAVAMIAAAEGAGLTPVVRINEVERSPILRLLDSGAQALVVPALDTVEQVQQVISFAKFAPLGQRGFCLARDDRWGNAEHASHGIPDYMATANAETLLLIQCETVGCLENIDAITALEGVDGIVLGPFDLSIAMDIPGKFDHPDFLAAVRRIRESCQKNNKLSVIFSGGAAAARTYLADGFNSVTVGLDVIQYINAYKALVMEVRQ